MSDFTLRQIFSFDKKGQSQQAALLQAAGIRQDRQLDYSCGLFDAQDKLVATGSLYGPSLRCLAVSPDHEGQGLLNDIVSHLIQVQAERGQTHLFIYTKPETSRFFADLGFTTIVEIPQLVTFMENRSAGFSQYLQGLDRGPDTGGTRAAIVLNANPFTLGHLALIEQAAAENDLLHLFMVSEDQSLFPFSVRRALIQEGTAHLTNLIYHETGPYLISQATFPSYFQVDDTAVIRSQAALDVAIFSKIAQQLGITRRYVGEEPHSLVTQLYNQTMQTQLPQQGVECQICPRKIVNQQVISASYVRQCLKEGDLASIQPLVPKTTYDYLTSPAAAPVITRIQAADTVIHY